MHLGAILTRAELIERRRLVVDDLERPLVVAAFAHLVEAGHGAFAGEIDDEVARDGEQPGVEAGLAVELRAAQQHADPGLLEEILRDLAVAGEEEQIAQQPVLKLFDQAIEQLGILALQALRDDEGICLGLGDGGSGDVRDRHRSHIW